MTLYLLDASLLITANKQYYPLDRVPEFWDWILENGEKGNLKIPHEIYEEIEKGTDDLAKWVKHKKKILHFNEEVDPNILNKVIKEGYAPDLDETDYQKIGNDPFLISYAYNNKDRCVVTVEVSKPSAIRGNRKIPDICKQFEIRSIGNSAFIRELNFSTRRNR